MPYRAAAESFVGHSEEFAKKAHRNADSPVVRSAATCQTAMGMDSQRLRILRNRTLSTQSLSKVADRLYRKRQSYEFVDGFEKYAVGSKIFNNMEQMKGFNDKFFFRFGGPWTQYLGTHKGVNAENNVFEVTDTLSYSGNKSFHFRIVQEDLDAAALQGAVVKNSLIKDDLVSHDPFAFGDGDIVSVSAYLYLPSGTNEWVGSQDNWNPYFLDVGAARQGLPSLPELRIASNKGPSGYFALNRKTFWEGMTPPNIATAPLAWPPLDEWFQLEMRFKVGVLPEDDLQSYPDQGYGAGRGVYEFDENAPAWFQLIIDGQVIIENTMTTRGGFENDGTVINSLEIGLTISGQASELYIDDVRLEQVASAFMEGNPDSGASSEFLDTLDSIENLIGSDYDDTLIGNADANRIQGGAGNDMLSGEGGDDVLIGGSGNDVLKGGAGNDLLIGGLGRDVFDFDNTSEAGDEIDDFETGTGGDVLDLADLFQDLGGVDPILDNLIRLEQSENDVVVYVDPTNSANFVPLVTLNEVRVEDIISENLVT